MLSYMLCCGINALQYCCRTRDYQKLVDPTKYKIKYKDAVASLTVTDVAADDHGIYTCEASNKHGFATTLAALRVKGNVRFIVSYLIYCSFNLSYYQKLRYTQYIVICG